MSRLDEEPFIWAPNRNRTDLITQEYLESLRFGSIGEAMVFLREKLGLSFFEIEDDELYEIIFNMLQVSENVPESQRARRISRNFLYSKLKNRANYDHLAREIFAPSSELKDKDVFFTGMIDSFTELTGFRRDSFMYNAEHLFYVERLGINLLLKETSDGRTLYRLTQNAIDHYVRISGMPRPGHEVFSSHEDSKSWEECCTMVDTSHKEIITCLRPHLKEGDKVLDIGAGTGLAAEILQDDPSKPSFYCIDGSKVMLKYLCEKDLPNVISTPYCPLTPSVSLPFDDNSVNHVTCNGVLLYLDELTLQRVLKEMARVLVPGGTVHCSFEDIPSECQGYPEYEGHVVVNKAPRDMNNFLSYHYTQRYITDLLAENGLHVSTESIRRIAVHQSFRYVPAMEMTGYTPEGVPYTTIFHEVYGMMDTHYTFVSATKI